MAEVLLQDQTKPSNEVDTYLAEKADVDDVSEEMSRTPSTQPDSTSEAGFTTTKVETPIDSSENNQRVYTFPEQPIPGCKPTPRSDLTPDQQRKYDALLETVKSWTSIPTASAKNSP